MKIHYNFGIIIGLSLLTACQSASKKGKNLDDNNHMGVVTLVPDSFVRSLDGKLTGLFTLTNSAKSRAVFTSFGARLVSLVVADKDGKPTDIVTGFSSIKDYQLSSEPYFGATIGRYANRIAKGSFSLEGKKFTLPLNNGENTLHGGRKGFQNVVWDVKKVSANTIEFCYLSKDMEEGFPGNLEVSVKYTLCDNDELKMEYYAKTDKPTVVNLTNHAFFNLNGEGNGDILEHIVRIYAEKYTPVDSSLIPTGQIASLKGSPFDFLVPVTIGSRILEKNKQLDFGKGYDHNYVLNKTKGKGMFRAASVMGNKSGIIMNIYTQEPGLQFYSGNFMQGKNTFKNGAKDGFRTAFAMETQHFPDSPNQPGFPSTVLVPGQVYHTSSIYTFTR